ncbi:MAG: hypothetical protein HKO54_12150 [Flavobacteriaceae bacterium]|nr:hypothetical protein [Flavobacteriaceae bacterium]
MKNLFKVIAFSFVMLLGMGTMNAQTLKQDESKPEVIAKKQTAELSEQLSLNGDQQRAVFRALVSKESNYKKHVLGQDVNKAAVAANKKKFDDQLKESMKQTLTADQYKKWLALQNQ